MIVMGKLSLFFKFNIKKAFFLTSLFSVYLILSACSADSYKFDPEARDGGYTVNTEPVNIPEEPEYFRIQINTAPEADAGEKIPFFIGNPNENKSDVQVRIYLAESKEEIYCSKILAPGEREVYGSLSETLEKGQYESLAVFSILDEDGLETGSVETGLIITIY